MDGILVQPKDHADVLQELRGCRVEGVGVRQTKSLYRGLRIVDTIAKAHVPINLSIISLLIANMPVIVEARNTA